MKKLFLLYSISVFLFTIQSATAQQNNPSEAPRNAMEKLSFMIGEWSSVMSISQDRGKTWNKNEANKVIVNPELGGMLLEQHNLTESKNGWNIKYNIAYDQYRNVYRQTVTDDTWGMMDIYEGEIDSDGRLVVSNVASRTFFPGTNGAWLSFRLVAELLPCQRNTNIDVSVDEGKQWIPYIQYQYTKLNDPSCATRADR